MPNLISFKGEDHIQAKISPKKKNYRFILDEIEHD